MALTIYNRKNGSAKIGVSTELDTYSPRLSSYRTAFAGIPPPASRVTSCQISRQTCKEMQKWPL